MLINFIKAHRSEILARCIEMGGRVVGDASRADLIAPLSEILTIVEKGLQSSGSEDFLFVENPEALLEAVEHGAGRASLGLDVAQVARDYGMVCDAVSSLAREHRLEMSVEEYRRMNLAIDGGIAASLKSFESFRQKEQQEASSHNIGSFVHELRNALSGATLACEMLSSGSVSGGGKTAEIIQRALSRMERMVAQLATRVMLDTLPESRKESLDVAEIIEESIETIIGSRRSRLDIVKDNRLEPLRVMGDRQLAVSAISNVIQNALKYGPEDKQVLIRSHYSQWGRLIVIEVQDFGKGICPKAQARLFEPFVRGIHNKSGPGLGLSIIRNAMEVQGGKIVLDSEPDSGTTVGLQFQAAVHGPA